MPNFVPFSLRVEVFSRDNFTCQKCGFKGMSEELEAHHIKMLVDGGNNTKENLVTLCSICHFYSPESEEDFRIYLSEKIEGSILETFRKSQKSISKRTKKGMFSKAQDGNLVTRAPYGYKIDGKQLIPDPNTSYIIPELFDDFLNHTISLTQLSKKYGFSVNGLKKILTNHAYLGKVKFGGQTHQGVHSPLISSTLFNHVQNKIENLGIKKAK